MLVGTFIGAGFVSGKEIATFFCGGEMPLALAYLAFVLFFIFIVELLLVGRSYGDIFRFNKLFFPNERRLIDGIFYFCSFVSAVTMLAGADAVISQLFGISSLVPTLSIFLLIISNLLCFKGVSKIAVTSVLLVPVIIVGVLVVVFSNGKFLPIATFTNNGFTSVKAVLYVGMNILFSAPIIVEMGKGKTTKQNICSSFLASLVVALLIFLVTSSLNYFGEGAIISKVPLLYLAGNGRIAKYGYALIFVFAVLTNLLSSLYPFVKKSAKNRRGKTKLLFLNFLLLAFSRLGLNAIVEYLYPIIGAMGVIYLLLSAYLAKIKRAPYKIVCRCLKYK